MNAGDVHPLIQAADGLILDIGCVLLSYEPKEIVNALLPERDRPLALRHVFGGPAWIELDRGTLDNQAAADAICAQGPLKGREDMVLRLLQAFPDHMHPLPLSNHLAGWKRQGKRLYALSNFHAEAYQRIRALHPFFDLMDGLLISSHERLIKPDPAIYRLLLDRFSLQPGRCCFIDDTQVNTNAAQAQGIPSIHYEGLHSVMEES